MSVASIETEIFKDKIEVSLDGRQVFYLFFGGAVIATLVFTLGVMVGRRVESQSVAEAGSPSTDPLAALDRLQAGSELAFPTTLRGQETSLGAVDFNLSKGPRAAPKPMPVGGPQPTAAAAEAVAVSIAKADSTTKKQTVPVVEPESESISDKAKPAAIPTKSVKAPKLNLTRRKFTLQVGSFQDKAEADNFFRSLAGTSYAPYMVEADVPGKGKYFRVRVGGYQSFDDAVAAKSEFEEKQHVIAYVTRLK